MLVLLFDIFVERENSLNLNKTGSKLQILWAKRPHFDAARTLNSGLIYTTVISMYIYILHMYTFFKEKNFSNFFIKVLL